MGSNDPIIWMREPGREPTIFERVIIVIACLFLGAIYLGFIVTVIGSFIELFTS